MCFIEILRIFNKNNGNMLVIKRWILKRLSKNVYHMKAKENGLNLKKIGLKKVK